MSDTESEHPEDKEEKGLSQIQKGEPQTSPAELTEGCYRWFRASYSFLYVEISSLVLLLACIAQWSPTPWFQYAMSVASISLGVCLILQTMEFLTPGFLKKPVIGEHASEKLCSVFLLLWWIFGTGFITFKGPFTFTQNGWFGAWGGLISTTHWCIGLDFVSYDSQSREVKYIINLAFCSIVTILASIKPLREKLPNYEGAGLAIASGAVTLIICSYLIKTSQELSKNVMKLTTSLLFVLWVITACICTYIGPFVITGNGFFACWFSALFALNIRVISRDE